MNAHRTGMETWMASGVKRMVEVFAPTGPPGRHRRDQDAGS
jgi:hypothetical protein